MKPFKSLAPMMLIAALGAPAMAADFSDPTWPCVQRKVEKLSLGLMWPYPIAESFSPDADLKSQITELAESLSLRRTPVEALAPAVAEFATLHKGNADILGEVFAQVFNGLSKRRTRIINGIGEFSLSQIGLAEQIDNTRVEMDKLMSAEAPDYDKVDALEEKLDWDQVIYSDRQQSITYLCETPTLLEKRLFEIAQLLQSVVVEG